MFNTDKKVKQATSAVLLAQKQSYEKTASKLQDGLFLKTEAALTDGEFDTLKAMVEATTFIKQMYNGSVDAAVAELGDEEYTSLNDYLNIDADGNGTLKYRMSVDKQTYDIFAEFAGGITSWSDIESTPDMPDGTYFDGYKKNQTLPEDLTLLANYVMLLNNPDAEPSDEIKERIFNADNQYREEQGQQNLFKKESAVEDRNPRITSTYEVVSYESAENGDFEETGFDDEEGESMLPDSFDVEEGLTPVDLAVTFLNKKGANYPSSSHFTLNGNGKSGIWYSTGSDDGVTDFKTGNITIYSYHLEDFTPEEEKAIFDKVAH